MKIAIIVEGKTERVFKEVLVAFFEPRLSGRMPYLDFVPYHHRIPKREKLVRLVANLLGSGKKPAEAVIALTDVYTGTNDFKDAADAKNQMAEWVGQEPRFHPHAAQYDFEAWLLPYWDRIKKLAKHDKKAPAGKPETVNHENPPSKRISEIFRIGACKRHYVKPRDAVRILRGQDLTISADACPELKSFLNTIVTLCEGSPLP